MSGRCGALRNCGKGQPQQVMGTGHGAAPARFRNIKVGSAYKGTVTDATDRSVSQQCFGEPTSRGLLLNAD